MATDDAPASPGEIEVRAALERVIASPDFRAAPRLASFLRFVVEATLAGNSSRIKGYSVAVGALGRGDSFDPHTDAIVRVEAGRLRRALERYYAGPGRHDPVVIDVPRGTYIPTFAHRKIALHPRSSAIDLSRLLPRALRRRFRLVVFVVCIAASVSVIFDLLTLAAERAIGGLGPTIGAVLQSYWTAAAISMLATIACLMTAWRIGRNWRHGGR